VTAPRRALALACACALLACRRAPAPEGGDLAIRVEVPDGEVAFGRAFPLTVVRTWSHELIPEEWSEEALAPLSVRLIEATTREDRRRGAATRRYQAHAFRRGELVVPPVPFRARPKDGSAERTAAAPELRLRVRSALADGPPGAPELPGGPLARPGRTLPWLAAAAALLTALALAGWRVARRRRLPDPLPSAPVPPAPPPPHLRALARLDELRAREPADDAANEAWHVDAASIVREYVGERFGVRALERTTAELLPAAPAEHRELLAGVLRRCDRVKFAAERPGSTERAALLETAVTFTKGSGPAAGPDPLAP
jgi:hypothetical protein